VISSGVELIQHPKTSVKRKDNVPFTTPCSSASPTAVAFELLVVSCRRRRLCTLERVGASSSCQLRCSSSVSRRAFLPAHNQALTISSQTTARAHTGRVQEGNPRSYRPERLEHFPAPPCPLASAAHAGHPHYLATKRALWPGAHVQTSERPHRHTRRRAMKRRALQMDGSCLTAVAVVCVAVASLTAVAVACVPSASRLT